MPKILPFLRTAVQSQNDNETVAMTRATFTIAVSLLCSTAAATLPPARFISPCECKDTHGESRLAVKNDPETPPADANAIQPVTPSQMFDWPGPDLCLMRQSERSGGREQWQSLTGRVVAVKVEADGDLHLALRDATGEKRGIVVCEVPCQQR